LSNLILTFDVELARECEFDVELARECEFQHCYRRSWSKKNV